MKLLLLSSLRRALTAALFVSLFAAPGFAQSTTDGAVGGTVYDLHDAVVPNAQIVVHNNGTNLEQTTTSDAAGFYRVQKLQPGTYTVTVNAEGLAPYKSEQVVVQVGSFTELAPHLNIAGASAIVDVSTETPQIDYNSPDFAATLNSNAIENLPINGGRWSNFAILTPTVVSDSSGFGLLSFRGISTLLNNNTVDGADNNQAFFSEERGRTRAGYSTAKASVEEFQVNTSDYSAEYGRSAGGVVNTVTKSGTNNIHGEAYFYDRDNDWGAHTPFVGLTNPTTLATTPYKPTDWRKMWGFGVGGPLIKDKLFWFFAYDGYDRNFPGTAIVSAPGTFFATPTAATINTLASHLGVSTAQATTDYNNGLSALTSMLGNVPRTGKQDILFPKLDWEINSKNHLSLSFNRMRWWSPAGIQTQTSVTDGIASFGNDYVKDTWGVAKLDSFITSNISNELRFQYGRDFELENNQAPTAYEQNTLVTPTGYTNPLGLPPQVSITNGFTFGVPSFLERPAYPDERRQQYADTLTVQHGSHTFKFGADISHVDDNAENLRNQYGSYSYSSLLNYFSDLYKPNSCGGLACYSSFSQAFGPLGFEFATNDLGFFVQDDWKVIPRLTLSFGLRYEAEMMPRAFSNLINPAVPQTGNLPNDQNNLGPRFGFAYDPFGNGKTVIRGGYGLYFGRIINSAVYNALVSTGMPGSQFQFTFTPTSPGAPKFPDILGTAPAGTGSTKPNIVYFDPNFQAPAIHEIDLSVERDIGWGTVVSASYLGSIGRALPDFVDQNVAPSTKNITYTVVNGGPLGNSTYTTPLYTARLNPNFSAMTDVFSGVHSSYNAFVIQLNHRMSHNLQFSANYTWSHSIDYGVNGATFTDTNDLFSPYNLKAEKANGIYDVPNRFVIDAVATSPWHVQGWAKYLANDWEFSPIFQIQNGLPYNLLTSGNAPGGIPGAASSVNGSGGTNRIDMLGRDSFRMPMTWVPDLRLSKRFTIRENYKLELAGDFFNLANHLNVTSVNTTGYFVSTSAVSTPTGTVACSAAAPCLNYNVSSSTFAPVFGTTSNANSNFVYSPRQIQLSARFQF